MSKKLNIIEAMKMPIGTEFEVVYKDGAIDSIKVTLKAPNGIKFLEWNSGNIVLANNGIIDATFIPIQQPVSFTEAITSGKRIKVDVTELNEKYDRTILNEYWNNVYISINDILNMLAGASKRNIIILEGKWYIEESEEQN